MTDNELIAHREKLVCFEDVPGKTKCPNIRCLYQHGREDPQKWKTEFRHSKLRSSLNGLQNKSLLDAKKCLAWNNSWNGLSPQCQRDNEHIRDSCPSPRNWTHVSTDKARRQPANAHAAVSTTGPINTWAGESMMNATASESDRTQISNRYLHEHGEKNLNAFHALNFGSQGSVLKDFGEWLNLNNKYSTCGTRPSPEHQLTGSGRPRQQR